MLTGDLKGDATVDYLVRAGAGQTMTVKLERSNLPNNFNFGEHIDGLPCAHVEELELEVIRQRRTLVQAHLQHARAALESQVVHHTGIEQRAERIRQHNVALGDELVAQSWRHCRDAG